MTAPRASQKVVDRLNDAEVEVAKSGPLYVERSAQSGAKRIIEFLLPAKGELLSEWVSGFALGY